MIAPEDSDIDTEAAGPGPHPNDDDPFSSESRPTIEVGTWHAAFAEPTVPLSNNSSSTRASRPSHSSNFSVDSNVTVTRDEFRQGSTHDADEPAGGEGLGEIDSGGEGDRDASHHHDERDRAEGRSRGHSRGRSSINSVFSIPSTSSDDFDTGDSWSESRERYITDEVYAVSKFIEESVMEDLLTVMVWRLEANEELKRKEMTDRCEKALDEGLLDEREDWEDAFADWQQDFSCEEDVIEDKGWAGASPDVKVRICTAHAENAENPDEAAYYYSTAISEAKHAKMPAAQTARLLCGRAKNAGGAQRMQRLLYSTTSDLNGPDLDQALRDLELALGYDRYLLSVVYRRLALYKESKAELERILAIENAGRLFEEFFAASESHETAVAFGQKAEKDLHIADRLLNESWSGTYHFDQFAIEMGLASQAYEHANFLWVGGDSDGGDSVAPGGLIFGSVPAISFGLMGPRSAEPPASSRDLRPTSSSVLAARFIHDLKKILRGNSTVRGSVFMNDPANGRTAGGYYEKDLEECDGFPKVELEGLQIPTDIADGNLLQKGLRKLRDGLDSIPEPSSSLLSVLGKPLWTPGEEVVTRVLIRIVLRHWTPLTNPPGVFYFPLYSAIPHSCIPNGLAEDHYYVQKKNESVPPIRDGLGGVLPGFREYVPRGTPVKLVKATVELMDRETEEFCCVSFFDSAEEWDVEMRKRRIRLNYHFDCTCELCELQTRMKRSNPESYQNMATLWNEMMLTSYAFKTGDGRMRCHSEMFDMLLPFLESFLKDHLGIEPPNSSNYKSFLTIARSLADYSRTPPRLRRLDAVPPFGHLENVLFIFRLEGRFSSRLLAWLLRNFVIRPARFLPLIASDDSEWEFWSESGREKELVGWISALFIFGWADLFFDFQVVNHPQEDHSSLQPENPSRRYVHRRFGPTPPPEPVIHRSALRSGPSAKGKGLGLGLDLGLGLGLGIPPPYEDRACDAELTGTKRPIGVDTQLLGHLAGCLSEIGCRAEEAVREEEGLVLSSSFTSLNLQLRDGHDRGETRPGNGSGSGNGNRGLVEIRDECRTDLKRELWEGLSEKYLEGVFRYAPAVTTAATTREGEQRVTSGWSGVWG